MGLKYFTDMKDAPPSDLLRQANIKIKNQLMAFSDSIWKDCPDTSRSKVTYIIFYKCGTIEHGSHVPEPVFRINFRGRVTRSMQCKNDFSTFQDVNS